MKQIMFGYCIQKDRCIYGFAKDFNMLCCWDVDRCQLKILGCIPGERFDTRSLSIKLILDGNDIYIIPFSAKKLWVYSIDSEKWESIELKDGKTKCKFMQAFIYGEELYMIGSFYNAIVKVNTITKEIKYIREIYDIIDQKYNNKNNIFLFDYCFKDEKTIYLPACLYGIVFEFNLENEEICTHFIGDISNGHDIIIKQDERFWLAPRYGGTFICWDGENVVDEFTVRINGQNNRFGGIGGYINGPIITFYSFMHKMTVSYNYKLNEIIETDNKMVYFSDFYNGRLLLQDNVGKILQIENGCSEIYDVRMSENSLREIAKYFPDMARENITLDLDFWLKYFEVRVVRNSDNKKNNIGSKIWNVSQKF